MRLRKRPHQSTGIGSRAQEILPKHAECGVHNGRDPMSFPEYGLLNALPGSKRGEHKITGWSMWGRMF